MKGKANCIVLLGLLVAVSAFCDIEFLAPPQMDTVFSDADRRICVTIRNSGAEAFERQLHYSIKQVAGSVTAPVALVPWKKLHLLPGQTVIECEMLSFPAVRSPTRFALRWMDGQRLLGKTDVLVYPSDLLHELKSIVSPLAIGVIDPQGVMKPLLARYKIDYEDLERTELEQFTGRLVIAGPFTDAEQVAPRLGPRLSKLAARGISAVWIQPPHHVPSSLPSWYCIRDQGKPIVVAQSTTVSSLADSPIAQLTLIEMVKAALHGNDFPLPETKD